MNDAIRWALDNGWELDARRDTLRKVKRFAGEGSIGFTRSVCVPDEALQGLTLEQAKRALVEAEETLDT